MNSLFIYIGVKPTVFQLLYGLKTILLAIDASKEANNTRKTESVQNRTVCSNQIYSNTSGTLKIIQK